MEAVDPRQVRLKKLLRLNSFLTIFFVIILALLSIFVVKHFLLAVVAVEKAGMPMDNVVNIVKYHFLAFFDSLGDLTSKYMLFVSLLLLINFVGLTINKIWKILDPRLVAIILFSLSIVIAFNLPIETIYLDLSKKGKTLLLLFCLLMMIPGPYILGRYLGKGLVIETVINRVLYVLIYGLLLVQIFIE